MDLLMHLLKAVKDLKLVKVTFIIYIAINVLVAALPIMILVFESMNDDQALIIDYQPLIADLIVLLKNSSIMFFTYMMLKLLYGRDISLWMNRYFTEQYVIKRMPNIDHIYNHFYTDNIKIKDGDI